MRFFLLLFCLLPALGSAQLPAPDLQCARSESDTVRLRWANAATGCGPFVATEIYRATDPAGPFTLIGEVTDPDARTFADPNPGAEFRLYYLQYRYACPGQAPRQSDTLDNFIPVTPLVRYLSLEDDNVVIDWLASPSPEVIAYVILEVVGGNLVALDTVRTGTRYTVAGNGSDPLNRRFRVVATDACGTDSPQSAILSVADLMGTGGSGCTAELTLVPDQATLATFVPRAGLELFVSVDGGPFTLTQMAPAGAAAFTYAEANDGERLCFYVEAVVAGDDGERARSTVFCTDVMIQQPVRDFPVYGMEIDSAGNFIFQFAAGANQPVATEAAYLINRLGNLRERINSLPTDLAGQTSLLLADPLADPLVEGETVAFRLTDDCGREVTTNAVAPVFLSANGLIPGQHRLDWTPLVNGLAGTTTYDLFRADPGQPLVSVATDLTDLTFTVVATEEACYKVRARFVPEGAAGRGFSFSSNRACVVPAVEVYVPNAFSPRAQRAENTILRPFFSSPVGAAGYRFAVYNRWGGEVFATDDPAVGWGGDHGGEAAAEGAYLYVLRYRSAGGADRERAGTVYLLR